MFQLSIFWSVICTRFFCRSGDKTNFQLFVKEKLDEEYHAKVEENRKAAEERTAKKRAKRLKKKKNAKLNGKKPKLDLKQNSSHSESSSEEDEGIKKDSDNTHQNDYEDKEKQNC